MSRAPAANVTSVALSQRLHAPTTTRPTDSRKKTGLTAWRRNKGLTPTPYRFQYAPDEGSNTDQTGFSVARAVAFSRQPCIGTSQWASVLTKASGSPKCRYWYAM